MEKIKVKSVQDRFDKDCRGIEVNGRRIMNIWRRRDGRWTYWDSDRFSNTYDTVAEAKAHIAELAAAGQI